MTMTKQALIKNIIKKWKEEEKIIKLLHAEIKKILPFCTREDLEVIYRDEDINVYNLTQEYENILEHSRQDKKSRKARHEKI